MNNIYNKNLIRLIILLFIVIPSEVIYAQEYIELPVYIVQSGDYLSSIANTFGITVNDLITTNNIDNPNALQPGMELKIPGLDGVTGKLIPSTIQLGENLNNLSIIYSIPNKQLITLNRVTSPNEIVAGMDIIIPENENTVDAHIDIIQFNENKLDIALRANSNPWSIFLLNASKPDLIPGDYYKSLLSNNRTDSITPLIENIQISPLPLQTGKTTEINIQSNKSINITGSLSDYQLSFVRSADNEYKSIQGVHVKEPGFVSTLTIISQDTQNGDVYEYSQNILLSNIVYGIEQQILVDPTTIDPTITTTEDELIKEITSVYTPEKYWSGNFVYPLDFPDLQECITATFGIPRSYNGGAYKSFHSGIDILGCVNNNIYAPAAGRIAYIGPLTVRGNATIIDHGLGVFSGYWHQSEIYVEVGQFVNAGDQIGLIGNTGRSNGAHLHWEIWVNGVQVDPNDWLLNTFL